MNIVIVQWEFYADTFIYEYYKMEWGINIIVIKTTQKQWLAQKYVNNKTV